MSSEALRAAHRQLWEQATRHPFLDGVRDGTLPEPSFQRWLVQDYHFVRGLLRAQAAFLAAAPRSDQRVLASGLVALVDELDWFEDHARRRGLTLDVPVHSTCQEYVDFLLALRERPYPVQITALWACEQAYLDAWTGAWPGAEADREFVHRWTQPGFAEYVAALQAAAQRALATAGLAELQAAEGAFCRVAELERRFWAMTWEGGER